RTRGVQRKRRVSALVITEVVTVQPHVCDVPDRTELEQRVCVAPLRRNEEVDSIETARRAAIGRWVERTGHLDHGPASRVIKGSRPTEGGGTPPEPPAEPGTSRG